MSSSVIVVVPLDVLESAEVEELLDELEDELSDESLLVDELLDETVIPESTLDDKSLGMLPNHLVRTASSVPSELISSSALVTAVLSVSDEDENAMTLSVVLLSVAMKETSEYARDTYPPATASHATYCTSPEASAAKHSLMLE